MQNNDFLSLRFQWFMGVIEDINDPEEINRARVRCFGYHTDDKNIVPTDSLPWASILLPTTSAGISGIGTSPHGLVNGSWVFGFFRDGANAQDPVVVGVLSSSYEQLPDYNLGFSDPERVYPNDKGGDLKDVSVLARAKNIIADFIDKKIGNPKSAYAAKYPHNKVTQTPSGHIFEVDDTEGAERIRVYHKSGTFHEIHPDGTVVYKNKDKYQITIGDDKAHVTGSLLVFVDGDANINVGGSTVLTTKKTTINSEVEINGDVNVNGVSKADDHISDGISGKDHKHQDTAGLGAGTTTPPLR